MARLLRDVAYAWRTLRKAPVFTAVAVLTLALGVGANSAIFSLISTVLLRPLPFPQPERLAFVWEDTALFGLRDSVVALANYVDWRDQSRSFQQMGALETNLFTITGGSEPLALEGGIATASLFRTLGIRPALGRGFRDEEDRPASEKTVILSDGLWRRLFGGDPGAIGRTLNLNDAAHTIVGVMAPGFRFPDSDTELWVPVGTRYPASEYTNRGRHNWIVAARLAPGVSLEHANSEIQAIGRRLEQQYPQTNRGVGAFVAPMREHFVGETRSALLVLSGAVGLVLLIACVNIANLLLARSGQRRREIAIRTAIGAGRRQLVRQLLTESLLLSFAGGVCGLALASWSVRFLAKLVPAGISGLTGLHVDGRVLGFTLAISILTGVAFGLLPAFRTMRLDLNHILKQGGRQTAGGRSRYLERSLVIAEVALAFVLTTGAGLLIQAFVHLRNADPGFRTHNLLAVRTRMPNRLFLDDGRRNAFLDTTLSRIHALPGVVSAGFTLGVPIAFKGWINGFQIEGQTALAAGQYSNSNFRVVTPDYLPTLGVPVLQGRGIDAHDRPGALPVALVNQAFERKFWPSGSAVVGKRFRFGDKRPWISIVGVVGDIRQSGLAVAPKAEMYLPAAQAPTPTDWLLVRTSGDPSRHSGAVRRELHAVDKDLPIREISTMEQILDREVFNNRAQALLLAAFAGLALLLASVGIYGVLAYMVAQRTGEIGIRMALGARPSDVLIAVAGQGVALSALGIVSGTLAALALTRLLSKLLFGITATDPLTFIAVAALLLLVAAVASYWPARRAMKVDPILALREE